MQYISLIISFVVALVVARIIYAIFESSGFKGVVIFKLTLQIILLIISMIINSVPFNLQTVLVLLRAIAIVFVGILISTAIEHHAYNKSNSFFSFIMYNILYGLIISMILTAVLFILLCIIKPVLLTNNSIKLMFIIILSVLAIIIVVGIIKFISNITTKKNISTNIEINEDVKNIEEQPVNTESPMLFCPNCGFKLDQKTKFCIGCGKYFNNK